MADVWCRDTCAGSVLCSPGRSHHGPQARPVSEERKGQGLVGSVGGVRGGEEECVCVCGGGGVLFSAELERDCTFTTPQRLTTVSRLVTE